MIVDDEPDLRDLLSIHLGSRVDRIFTAADGQEALEIIDQHPGIDAVISDIRMPRLDGVEFLKALRGRGLATPVIFLSAFGEKETVVEALRAGSVDFLDKPVDVKNLQIFLEFSCYRLRLESGFLMCSEGATPRLRVVESFSCTSMMRPLEAVSADEGFWTRGLSAQGARDPLGQLEHALLATPERIAQILRPTLTA